MAHSVIDPGVRIGHVHLKVADLERSLAFYRDVLGFEVTTTRPGAAFLSAGGITTTSRSTHGKARADSHPLPARPGFIM